MDTLRIIFQTHNLLYDVALYEDHAKVEVNHENCDCYTQRFEKGKLNAHTVWESLKLYLMITKENKFAIQLKSKNSICLEHKLTVEEMGQLLADERGIQEKYEEDEDCALNQYSYEDIVYNYFFDVLKSITETFVKQLIQNEKDKEWNLLVEKQPECPVLFRPLVKGDCTKLQCGHLLSLEAFLKMKERSCPLCRGTTLYNDNWT